MDAHTLYVAQRTQESLIEDLYREIFLTQDQFRPCKIAFSCNSKK